MKQCEICGNEIPRTKKNYPKSYAEKKFCSKACRDINLATRVDYSGPLKCSKCKVLKPGADFRRDGTTPRGYSYYCKQCMPRSVLPRRVYERDDQVNKAQRAVYNAVRRGDIPNIASVECARCHAMAAGYHHPSYHPNDHFNIIPLCVSCHRLAHIYPEVAAEVERGIVLTSVGMVRIAISSSQ